jgi:hypothetical protein
MPITATIVLDSGVFLTEEAPDFPLSVVGYFQSDDDSASDVMVYVDGQEQPNSTPLKLGNSNREIDVRHKRADGTVEKNLAGATCNSGYLLSFTKLYDGQQVEIKRDQFDCILYFNSGHFCSSLVKKRLFKDTKATPPTEKSVEPIAHNVEVHYELGLGDELELVDKRTGAVIWTTRGRPIMNSLRLEILADNSTASKFYSTAVQPPPGRNPWLPNQGDPPPILQP